MALSMEKRVSKEEPHYVNRNPLTTFTKRALIGRLHYASVFSEDNQDDRRAHAETGYHYQVSHPGRED